MARRPGLDREAVVQAAVELLDSEGVGSLSLGRLAERLGVQTPSLYNHVDGMPGLLRQLALRNARDLAACMGDAAMGRSGPEALLAVAEAYRGYIKQHPGLYMASLRASGYADAGRGAGGRRVGGGRGARRTDRAGGAGVVWPGRGRCDSRCARAAQRGTWVCLRLEVAGGFGLPLDCDESFRRLIAMLVAGLQDQAGASLAELAGRCDRNRATSTV